MSKVYIEVKYPIENEDQFKLAADIISNGFNKQALRLENGRLYVSENKDFYPIERFPKSWVNDEPKVLTAELIKKSVMENYFDNESTTGKAVDETIIISHDNGRLERDLELRPLLDAVEKYEDNFGDYSSRNEIVKAYSAIPPLTED